MSLLNDWLVGSREIPMAKAAAYLSALCRPAVPPPMPERTPLVVEGQVKIASIVMDHGVEALPEIERAAMVDPAVNAALDYEQTKAENTNLQQQLEASQAQLAMTSQQAQMAEQQAQESAQAQEELQGQVEQSEQEKMQLQQQALDAQEASLSERVQTMEQREQLAMAASQLKEQLQNMAEGVGQLRAQAAGPPPGPAPEPLPEPDPTAPADVQKEQEQAQKAELEAEQQKAQAGLAEEQEAVEQEVENAQAEEGAAMAEPPPEPPMGEEMAPPGPGGPVAGAPQVPTPAGGALPKTSSAKLAAGSTTVELPMSQYPKAPAKDVIDGASALKLPSAGRVIPAIKKLTEESSRLDSAVDKEQLVPDEQPELGKKEDPELKEKQASMWTDTASRLWLAKVGAADMPVEDLAEQLKMLSTEELQDLFRSLAEDPEGEQVTIARKRAMTIPSEGPAQSEEEYSVAMDGDEVARRAAELDMPKQAFVGVTGAPRGVLKSALIGAGRGAAVGGVTGGVSRGIAHRDKGFEGAMIEAGKGGLAGAATGAAVGAIGGGLSPALQRKALGQVPMYSGQTGGMLDDATRSEMFDRTRGAVMKTVADTPALIAGLIAGSKGPEAAESVLGRKKEGSALHPRLLALLEKEAEVSPEFKEKHDRQVLDISERLGRGVGSRRGARTGTWVGGLTGGALGGAALRKAPGGRLGGALIGATIGGLSGRASGAGIGAFAGGAKGRRLGQKTLAHIAPEEYEAREKLQKQVKQVAQGKGTGKDLSDTHTQLRAAKALTLQNIRDARARGEI
jgi:hypothetical protein